MKIYRAYGTRGDSGFCVFVDAKTEGQAEDIARYLFEELDIELTSIYYYMPERRFTGYVRFVQQIV